MFYLIVFVLFIIINFFSFRVRRILEMIRFCIIVSNFTFIFSYKFIM